MTETVPKRGALPETIGDAGLPAAGRALRMTVQLHDDKIDQEAGTGLLNTVGNFHGRFDVQDV